MVVGELPVKSDLLVIGGGPGGYAAAFRAADLGVDVTLVTDEAELGGVCLLRGCIPSKALLSLTELLHRAEEASEMGVSFEKPSIDLDRLREWKDRVVGKLTGGLKNLCEERGIRLIQGRATFHGEHRVRLEGGDVPGIEFKQAIIATGSRPIALPDTTFEGPIMDSAAALDLEEVPANLLVVGGGYVGLEMGMVYDALGSKVTMVEMEDRILPLVDEDLVKPLADVISQRFDNVWFQTKVSSMAIKQEGVEVTFEGEAEEQTMTFDRVLVAIGRKPNSQNLGLSDAGVKVDDRGFIQVDEQRRTTAKHIFAIGDVAGGFLLAHEAMREGKVAAEVIAGQPAAFDNRAIPAVVYTDPQVAWCGLTEQQAQEQGRDVKVFRFPWRASGRALSMNAPEGMTKVICDPETQRILGVGVVGLEAEALIAEGVLAIEMGAVAEDLAVTIHPHPTLTETLGEAAEMMLGKPIHVQVS